MLYNRGNPRDYNNWASLTGDVSWRYAQLLQHFKNIETYTGAFPSDQHGTEGPLSISSQSYSPGVQEWLEAGKQLGYAIADPNGPQRVSFTPVEFNKKQGQRADSYTAFLKPIQTMRNNLKVITGAVATKIVSIFFCDLKYFCG